MKKFKDFVSNKSIIIDNLKESIVLSLVSDKINFADKIMGYLKMDGSIVVDKDIIEYENKKYDVIFKFLKDMNEKETDDLISKWTKILENRNIKIDKIFNVERNDKDDFLIESLNTESKKISWIKRDEYWRGSFDSEGIEYKILIDKQDFETYLYKFVRKDDNGNWVYSLSKDKKYSSTVNVLATVRDGFEYFIKEKDPDGIIFSAVGDSESRKEIYIKFCMNIINKYPQYQYRHAKGIKEKTQLYCLNKWGIEYNNIIKVIKSVSNGIYIQNPIDAT